MYTPIYKAGFLGALFAFLAMLTYTIVQVLQVLRIITFPMDEILIYGSSLCIVIPYLVTLLALQHITEGYKKFMAGGALIFGILYAVFVTANYVVQLATVLPHKLNGNLSAVAVLDQTPHSMFWNFDAIGYICMGIASLMLVPLFNNKGFEKWVRLSLVLHAAVTPLICIVYFYPVFSEKLLLLGFPWGITAPFSLLMLTLFFRRKFNERDNMAGSKIFIKEDVLFEKAF